MKLQHIISASLLAVVMTACHSNPQWTVKGKIAGADGGSMVLEANNGARWYHLDSVKIASDGTFSTSHNAPGYPDIYRLRLNDRTIYFPVDSIETVSVTSTIDNFGSTFTLAGSPLTDQFMDAERRIADAYARLGADAAPTDSLFKRELAEIILREPGSIVAYYIVNKRVNGAPIFNPAVSVDRRIIGAVANAFMRLRPGDTRTAMLSEMYLSNRNVAAADTIEAHTSGIIDIPLTDASGTARHLSSIVDTHPVVVLNFTAYTADFAPALNVILNRVYDKYRSRGLEIYQVGFDSDEYKWREAAQNLPWVTVYNPVTDGSAHLRNYNVGQLPAIFIIANGQIVERLTDIDKLDSAVARRL